MTETFNSHVNSLLLWHLNILPILLHKLYPDFLIRARWHQHDTDASHAATHTSKVAAQSPDETWEVNRNTAVVCGTLQKRETTRNSGKFSGVYISHFKQTNKQTKQKLALLLEQQWFLCYASSNSFTLSSTQLPALCALSFSSRRLTPSLLPMDHWALPSSLLALKWTTEMFYFSCNLRHWALQGWKFSSEPWEKWEDFVGFANEEAQLGYRQLPNVGWTYKSSDCSLDLFMLA